MEPSRSAQTVISLVLKREDLLRRRAEIDLDIEQTTAEIEQVVAGRTTQNGTNVQRGVKTDDVDTGDEDEQPSSNLSRLIMMLTQSSSLDYGKAAIELYGEDSEITRKRVRSGLGYLQRKNKIRRTNRGEWEVIG